MVGTYFGFDPCLKFESTCQLPRAISLQRASKGGGDGKGNENGGQQLGRKGVCECERQPTLLSTATFDVTLFPRRFPFLPLLHSVDFEMVCRNILKSFRFSLSLALFHFTLFFSHISPEPLYPCIPSLPSRLPTFPSPVYLFDSYSRSKWLPALRLPGFILSSLSLNRTGNSPTSSRTSRRYRHSIARAA
jgi:hypothetical protein